MQTGSPEFRHGSVSASIRAVIPEKVEEENEQTRPEAADSFFAMSIYANIKVDPRK